MSLFRDRRDAGKVLAAQVVNAIDDPDTLVLALPRGGVPVAVEVAQALQAPMDVFVVRKLGLPGEEELAIGAIASGGVWRPVRWRLPVRKRTQFGPICPRSLRYAA